MTVTPVGGGSPINTSTGFGGAGYRFSGLRAGSYHVRFGCTYDSYVDEYYNDVLTLAGATPVVVVAGTTEAGIDAGLAAGGTVTGRVTREDTGTPLVSICVFVTEITGLGAGSVYTATNGTYSVGGLPAGTYRV